MQNGMHTETERCLRAVQSKDARFDGWFFTAVTTTRIYCRPSCPVVPPKPQNMTFFPSAAACQQAGFRACKRCRPDTSPGSPEWNHRADLVARAMRLIGDGIVDREGVPGLATRLGYSTRQIERQLLAELGAGPLSLARAQRAQTARLLIETTPLPMAEIAFAAGFSSIRTFNDTVREVFALSPTELRARLPRKGAAAAAGVTHTPGVLNLRLPFRAPLHPDNLFGHLAATAVPGVEEWRDGAYRRTLRLPYGHGIVGLTPTPDHIACRTASATCATCPSRSAAAAACSTWTPTRSPSTTNCAGTRCSRPWSTRRPAAGCRARSTRPSSPYGPCWGSRSPRPPPGRTRPGWSSRTATRSTTRRAASPTSSPHAAALAALDPASLAMPRTRRTTFTTLVAELAEGRLHLGMESDWTEARARLLELPGFGPWTVDVIAMRALGDPDAFLPTDLGIRYAAKELGLPSTPAALTARAAAWRPWRAYAVQYLWATASHPINFLPA